ncbi:hypothetical protein [Actinoallomurus rhizosphaericola]|uniref:hypothetical protein n=1 Tax=Actinoallomurus rhizosphaericola TaxID=2952536 RepID=UPI002091D090|nr:hypothetical protein [Actinoallomurus rhizosphaericola]MCO5993312.1 hypothetical protein [Actinoallomurus rhizosphaericola]
MSLRTKALLGLTAAAVGASALVPAAAQAATGRFTFCNISSARETVQFPQRGWLSSTIVDPGACWSYSFSGIDYEEAVATREVNGAWPAVDTTWFHDSEFITWRV